MKLPENPTQEQLQAGFAKMIETVYTDGVDEILDGPFNDGNILWGKFRGGRKVFDVEVDVKSMDIDYAPAPETDPSEFAETSDPTDDPTAIQSALTNRANPIVEGWIDQVRTRLAEGDGDLADFAEKLDTLMPEMDANEYNTLMAEATSLSHLAGRASAQLGGNDANP